jgi:hypothetical protein
MSQWDASGAVGLEWWSMRASASRDKGELMRRKAGIAAAVAVVGVAGGLAATMGSTAAHAASSAQPNQAANTVPNDLLVSTSR